MFPIRVTREVNSTVGHSVNILQRLPNSPCFNFMLTKKNPAYEFGFTTNLKTSQRVIRVRRYTYFSPWKGLFLCVNKPAF